MGNLNNNSYQKITLITEVREKPRSDGNLDNIDVINCEKPRSDSNINTNYDVIKYNSSVSDPTNIKTTHRVKFRLSSSENDLGKCKSPYCQNVMDDVFHFSPIDEPDAVQIHVQSGEDFEPDENNTQDVVMKTHCSSIKKSSQQQRIEFERSMEKEKRISQSDRDMSNSDLTTKKNRFSLHSASDFNLSISSGFAEEVTHEFLKLLKSKEAL